MVPDYKLLNNKKQVPETYSAEKDLKYLYLLIADDISGISELFDLRLVRIHIHIDIGIEEFID